MCVGNVACARVLVGELKGRNHFKMEVRWGWQDCFSLV